MNRVTYDGKDCTVVAAVFPDTYKESDVIMLRLWGNVFSSGPEYGGNVALLRRMAMRALTLAQLRGASLVVLDDRQANLSSEFRLEFERASRMLEVNGVRVIIVPKPLLASISYPKESSPPRTAGFLKNADSLTVRGALLLSTILNCYAFIRFALRQL